MLKKIICLLIAFIFLIFAARYFLNYSNQMKSEYLTAQAIKKIQEYLMANDGKWPDSAEKLGENYVDNKIIKIDYTITSKELIDNPNLLRKSVAPASEKFLTYPHYESDLRDLMNVITETNH